MTRRRSSFETTLWGITNLCQIVMNIFLRRENEREQRSLNEWRALKIRQDIAISRTRQAVLTTNANIHIRRSEHRIEQDVRQVEVKDLQIELQKLKIMELKRKLGLTDDEFAALGYEDPNPYLDQNGVKKR